MKPDTAKEVSFPTSAASSCTGRQIDDVAFTRIRTAPKTLDELISQPWHKRHPHRSKDCIDTQTCKVYACIGKTENRNDNERYGLDQAMFEECVKQFLRNTPQRLRSESAIR